MNEPCSSAENLMQLLHKGSPYDGFPLAGYQKDLAGWHSNAPIFGRLIEEFKPSLVVEVGSWLGASAIEMAGHMKTASPGGRILCIDTWLGAAEFWMDKTDDRYSGLCLKHGYPQVYYQFLANVQLCGAQDAIVPFPQTSINAACWLAKNSIQADLIYVDASHEEEDVYADLKAYWPLVRPGGAMFGDDYDEYWAGVVLAVNRFAEERGLKVVDEGGFWIVRKPAGDVGGGGDAGARGYGELTALRAENSICRSRLHSIQLENARLHAEKAKFEVRAGFFFTQLEAAKAESERLRADKDALRAKLDASQVTGESLRIEQQSLAEKNKVLAADLAARKREEMNLGPLARRALEFIKNTGSKDKTCA